MKYSDLQKGVVFFGTVTDYCTEGVTFEIETPVKLTVTDLEKFDDGTFDVCVTSSEGISNYLEGVRPDDDLIIKHYKVFKSKEELFKYIDEKYLT